MLGISIYPEKGSKDEIKQYIKLASTYGYKRIFSCLLSFEGSKEELIDTFKWFIDYSNELEYEVYLDIAPNVLERLNIPAGDLSLFAQLGVAGVRLDMGYGGMMESIMSFNPYDLNIEVNMSMDTHMIDTIMDCKPRNGKVIGCHNFYPQKHSGLTVEHFVKSSENFKRYNLRTAAFVSSQVAKIGPWPITDGLCTIEEHRNQEIRVQAKHLCALNLIDDIIIANMFASEEELKLLANLERGLITLDINVCQKINSIEDDILFKSQHFNRGDINAFAIRSIMARLMYSKVDNPPRVNNRPFKRGDIVIGNTSFGQYKNELQVILQDESNIDNKRNLVATIKSDELYLLDYITAWQHFNFKEIE